MVLSAGTALILGQSLSPTISRAIAEAATVALTRPVPPSEPGPPAQIVTTEAEHVRGVASDLGLDVPVVEIAPISEAEDIVDSLLGHLAGRRQPHEPPSGDDWRLLLDQCHAYLRAEPWQRWSDDATFQLVVRTAAVPTRHTLVVMGAAGMVRGLALYAGDGVPASVLRGEPNLPEDALVLMLDSAEELPTEFSAKAWRYGWPVMDVVPGWLSGTARGVADISRDDAHRLVLAIAAILAHDAKDPALAARPGEVTTGRVELPARKPGGYSISIS